MRAKKSISEAVIKRLPRYYRYLSEQSQMGIKKISSSLMSKQLGYTASQVRQDLSNFGEFGQQGYGYDVEYLKEQIVSIIGLTKTYNMIVIGAGNIGRALTNYTGFAKDGFVIRAAFDKLIKGTENINGIDFLNISDLESYLKSNSIDIAIIAVSKNVAEQVAAQLVELGIKAIWNFAPIELNVPDDVKVENINMSESLYTLCYRVNN